MRENEGRNIPKQSALQRAAFYKSLPALWAYKAAFTTFRSSCDAGGYVPCLLQSSSLVRNWEERGKGSRLLFISLAASSLFLT